MSTLTLRAQAFGPLSKVEWTIPEGVSAIVGPNRVGKSTLLSLPHFLRLTVHENINEAVREVFDGPAYIRNWNTLANANLSIGITSDDDSWDLIISLAGGGVASNCEEQLRDRNNTLLKRDFGATHTEIDGRRIAIGATVLPRISRGTIVPPGQPETHTEGPFIGQPIAPIGLRAASVASRLAAKVNSFLLFRTYEYQLTHLLRYGSRQSSDVALLRSGENVFPLLRNWRDDSDLEIRFDFVANTLREAFPHFRKIDFEQAGQSVTMAIRDARWSDRKLPISRESTGFVTALLQLAAVASCPANGLVALDELETSLHPRAIQVLTEAFRTWSHEHNIRIVLATQSETVLDQFHDCPEQIYVLEPNQETSPRSLTDMFGTDWLSQFSLGDLFAHLEFGSNREPPSGP